MEFDFRLRDTEGFPLVDMERAMKLYVEQYRPGRISRAEMLAGIRESLSGRSEEIRFVMRQLEPPQEEPLGEELFFPSDMDATILRHMRYSITHLHAHDFIELVYVHRGRCVNQFARQSLTMEQGSLCIIPPGTRHRLVVEDDESVVLNILARKSTFRVAFFDLFRGDNILASFFINAIYGRQERLVLLFSGPENGGLDESILRMYWENQRDGKYRSRIMVSFFRLVLAYLLQDHEDSVLALEPEGEGRRENLVPVLQYIQENLKTVTLSRAAAHFNFSEAYLSRLFKKTVGENFGAAVHRARLAMAGELLRTTELPVEEIAAEVGYGNLSSFYRSFKSAAGLTPAAYRQKLLDAD